MNCKKLTLAAALSIIGASNASALATKVDMLPTETDGHCAVSMTNYDPTEDPLSNATTHYVNCIVYNTNHYGEPLGQYYDSGGEPITSDMCQQKLAECRGDYIAHIND